MRRNPPWYRAKDGFIGYFCVWIELSHPSCKRSQKFESPRPCCLGTMLRLILVNPFDHDINGQWAAAVRVRYETSKARQAPAHTIKFKTQTATLGKVFVDPGL